MVWIVLTFLTNSSYVVFLITSLFATSLSLLKLIRAVSNLTISNLSALLSKMFKSIGTLHYKYLIHQDQILNKINQSFIKISDFVV